MSAFFFDYRKGIYSKYSGLFTREEPSDDEPTSEAEKKRIKKEAERNQKFAWFAFFYQMAKGCPVKMKEILELNFIYLLNFRSYEVQNKKTSEYYDYGRYNVTEWAQSR